MNPSSIDREWFGRCVVEALADLFGAALRLTRNRADADDLVAEAVAKGWTHLDTLTDRTRFRGWLFRILTNGFLSARRMDARRGAHEPLEGDGSTGKTPESSTSARGSLTPRRRRSPPRSAARSPD